MKTMTATYTSKTFPTGLILIEEQGEDGTMNYTWEDRTGKKEPCSVEFVKARKHAWTRRPI